MRYYTEIDAVEELESVDMTDGIMLTGEDCLMRISGMAHPAILLSI